MIRVAFPIWHDETLTAGGDTRYQTIVKAENRNVSSLHTVAFFKFKTASPTTSVNASGPNVTHRDNINTYKITYESKHMHQLYSPRATAQTCLTAQTAWQPPTWTTHCNTREGSQAPQAATCSHHLLQAPHMPRPSRRPHALTSPRRRRAQVCLAVCRETVTWSK